ncbi:MAG: sulfotransferase domain-containing protein [Alphaproteobacteria bacterium]|nr:sulfotransferase domain-containing protein [Alphaproteobacteria bacterium]
MDRIAVIATHHKSGTVWLNHTFRKIGEALSLRVVNVGRDAVLGEEELAPPLILLAANSKLDKYPRLMEDGRVRALHVVRDPRDVLISSMHYHGHAQEKWLARPSDRFGGHSYREALAALTTPRARYLFEMEHSTADVVAAMLAWSDPKSFETRYEELMRDTEGELFARIARHLGFTPDEVETCRGVFWQHALFGGSAHLKGQLAHVRSGAPEQWRTVFDRTLGEAFAARLGGSLIQLGYERDTRWIEQLPPISAGLDAPLG